MNYRDLIQLAPEQCEKLKRTLRVFSECDMERSFKKSQEAKKRTRKRGTFGLAEMERCIGEIWKALLPARSVAGNHRNLPKKGFRNFYYGHCLDMEISWRKLFPEVWDIFSQREYYKSFTRISDHERLKMKALIFDPKWEKVVVCR